MYADEDVVLYDSFTAGAVLKKDVEEVDPQRVLLEYFVAALTKHPDLAAAMKIVLTEKP